MNAINAVADKSVLPECDLYVSLEPCSHHGKTPPCSDLLAEHKIKRVIIGTVDTFSQVAGRGIERLRAAGIDVTVGVLEDECRFVNRRFFCFNEKKRPYVILKWAQTDNGLIGRTPEENHLDRQISNPAVNMLVHRWRTEEDAILVGKNTAIQDNPRLTARLWQGKNPLRVLIDPELTVPPTLNIFSNESNTLVFNGVSQAKNGHLSFEKIDFTGPIQQLVLEKLYERSVQSVIIEGGSITLQHFIDTGLWDEARIITSPVHWKKGVKAPVINGRITARENVGGDVVTWMYREAVS